MHDDWVKLVSKIANDISPLTCPECGNQTIEFSHIGNTETRIGYLQIWCLKCNKGIYISRIKVPEMAKMIDINDTKKIRETIPEYTFVSD